MPLNFQLQNGDVVEILTSKSPRGPSRDWLNANLGYLKTSNAREKVRQWFKKQKRQENIEKGSEILDRELHRLGLTLSEAQGELRRQFRQDSWDDFLATLGYGGISLHQVALKLAPLITPKETPVEEAPPQAPAAPVYTSAIRVLGTGDLLTQLARCCNPVPGDAIIGYVTRSRGVTVHRRDCHNVTQEDEPERLVGVEWGKGRQLYPVAARIEALDRVGLMRDISTLVAETMLGGISGVSVLARHAGAEIMVIDIGLEGDVSDGRIINRKIRRATGNIARGPAMDREEALRAIETGIELASSAIDRGADILGTGEIGIGNTTTASAVL